MGSPGRVRRHELDTLMGNQLPQGLPIRLTAHRQTSRALLGRPQRLIDADPKHGVIVDRPHREQAPGTAINLLEPGANQVLVGIGHSGDEMQCAVLEVIPKGLTQPAALVGTWLAVHDRDDGG
jgi:hypothetical protein